MSNHNLTFVQVKTAVLSAYEQTPETYRERFRASRKANDQSYLEFVRELVHLFTRWRTSLQVTTVEELCNLMIVEQFRNSLPKRLSSFLGDRGVKEPMEAAALVDDYIINHRGESEPHSRDSYRRDEHRFHSGSERITSLSDHRPRGEPGSDSLCHHCKRTGHWRADCPLLRGRDRGESQPKHVRWAGVVPAQGSSVGQVKPSSSASSSSTSPFVMRGYVSLVGQKGRVPVSILRDTGADVSLISEKVLPFSVVSDTGDSVLVRGLGLETVPVPLHTVMVESELVQGKVVMGVRPESPGKDVDNLLGNDLAGWRVYPGVPPPPVVVNTPTHREGTDDNSQTNPEVFTACAVTRAMSRTAASPQDSDEKPEIGVLWSDLALTVSSEFIREQQSDSSLTEKFGDVLSGTALNSVTQGYFLQDGLLLRKWVPHIEPFVSDPIAQVVVPVKYREMVLSMAHNESGHGGVRKTFDRLARSFFWPRMKRDVFSYIRTCHTCQLTGKPNQSLKPVPLHPIPAIGQPFEHLIIDCVGQGHVRPVRAKVHAIDSYPVPTTKKELMRFLGLVGYYRVFCRNFSSVVAPLTDLLKGTVPFVWSTRCQLAFDRVRSLLCSEPVLAAPRLDQPFQLQVDASQVGGGGSAAPVR